MATTTVTSFWQIRYHQQFECMHIINFVMNFFILKILARCAGSNYHFRGSCSFEWLIKNLNTSKAIFSKYGLMNNLNNLVFVSWTTSTNSTMKTSRRYANLIKIYTLTMREICVKISFSYVNLLVLIMGCIFVITTHQQQH